MTKRPVGHHKILKMSCRIPLVKLETVAKGNTPILETLEIPAHKLFSFKGLGGHNLKKLTSETGVSVIPMEGNEYPTVCSQTKLLCLRLN